MSASAVAKEEAWRPLRFRSVREDDLEELKAMHEELFPVRYSMVSECHQVHVGPA
jgi:hypothetical protein